MTIQSTLPAFDVRSVVDAIRRPKDDLFLIAAHRALRWSGAPDNSYAAVRRASDQGLTIVELDIQLTSDGVPIVFHDDLLGRSTDIAEFLGRKDVYTPFTGKGYSPPVSQAPWYGLLEHLHLKDERGVITDQPLVTLQQMLRFIHKKNLPIVVFLDIKTALAVPVCAKATGTYSSNGISAWEWCLWKLDASWYTSPESLETSCWYKQAIAEGHQPLLLPVLRPETARSFDALQTAKAFHDRPYVVGFEVGLRSPNGFLQDVVDYLNERPHRKGLVFFAPLGDIPPCDLSEMQWDLGSFDYEGICKTEWTFVEGGPPRRYTDVVCEEDSVDGRDHRWDIATYRKMGFSVVIGKRFLLDVLTKADHCETLLASFRDQGLRDGEERLRRDIVPTSL